MGIMGRNDLRCTDITIRQGMVSYLFFLDAVFEDILHHQAPCFTQCNFVPHPLQRLIHLGHDLGRLATPSKLEELLPNVAGIPMNNRLWDSAEKFMHHNSFVILRNTIKRLLNDVTTKRIHTQAEGVASDRIRDSDNLIRCSVLEASLNKEVSKAVDHQRVRLADNGLDDVKLLLRCADFELLLQENGCLLIIVAYNLVHNVFPVTRDILVEEASIIEWFKRRNVGLYGASTSALEEGLAHIPSCTSGW